ncbi:hypothetical protein MJI39_23455, partial [Salmonella enterica subsp. enterica serovar Kentucky]|nr:hypothetical protein [Salmonella enterica subsp. enterica serovar Kentucky]
EVAEVSNCSEHFKFWKDNKGKVDNNKYHHWAEVGANKEWYEYYDEDGSTIQISVDQAHKLTLVEECSDALHFILSLANQNGFEICDVEHQSLINAVLDFPLNRQHSLESDYLSLQKCIQKVDYVESFMCGYNDMVQLVASFIIYYEKLDV